MIIQKKSTRQSRNNWKTTNETKFINTLKKQISKSLSNQMTKRQRINEYTKQLFKTLKQTIEIFTSWVKFHEIIKAWWISKCTKIVKKTRHMRRNCRIVVNWTKYVKIYHKKNKIIRKQKWDKFRIIMQRSKQFSKKIFEIVKWTRNTMTNILTQTTIFFYKREQLKLVTTTQEKTKIIFQTHYLLFSKIFMNDIENFDYLLSIETNVSLTNREIKWIIYKTILNKTSKHIDYTNKVIRKLIDDASKQMRSLFEKCF